MRWYVHVVVTLWHGRILIPSPLSGMEYEFVDSRPSRSGYVALGSLSSWPALTSSLHTLVQVWDLRVSW